tara:strand:- start:260 stop:1579 length:1320 start_codon:yes stop_codon:yes gene_type:complete
MYFQSKDKESMILSGDDLHRWPRGDKMWEKYTHLNPHANYLDRGIEDLKNLKSNIEISRNLYNHKTGNIDKSKKIFPKSVIIFEGLHSLYDKPYRDLCDAAIYVNTNHKLKKKWKIERDTNKRGYTVDQVLNNIKKRKPDEISYIEPQKKKADIILYFEENNKKINLKYKVINDCFLSVEYLDGIIHLYNSICDFVKISNKIGNDKELIQNGGGNLSFKIGDDIISSQSGKKLEDINIFNGYAFTKHKSAHLDKAYRPTMEINAHRKLPNLFNIHVHPIYLNAILCCKESAEIINSLYHDISYEYVKCRIPGDDLADSIVGNKESVFVENHGLFISTNDLSKSIDLLYKITNRAKNYVMSKLGTNFLSYDNFSLLNREESRISKHLFPDSVVLDINCTINAYIDLLIKSMSFNPRYLTLEEIDIINNLKSEKYRKKILT